MQSLDFEEGENDLDSHQFSTLPIEVEFQSMRSFLEAYTKQLHDMEDTLEQYYSRVWTTSSFISLRVEPHEETPLPDLVSSDNKPLSKVLMVISAICIEIAEYRDIIHQRFYAPLAIFDDTPSSISSSQNNISSEEKKLSGDLELYLANMLAVFMDMYNFSSRLNALCINLVHQLAALYNPNQKLYKSTFKKVHLRPAFDALGSLLSMLASLDECIAHSTTLSQNGLIAYRKMVRNMKSDPTRYGVTEEKLLILETRLQNLDEKLLEGSIFRNCVCQNFDVPGLLEVTSNKAFLEEFLSHLETLVASLDESIDSQKETFQRQQLIGACSLYIFYRRLTAPHHKPNKKLFTNLWQLCKKCPLIHIHGPVMIQLLNFLLANSDEQPPLIKVKPGELDGVAKSYLSTMTTQLPKQVQSFYLQVSTWMVRIESGTENNIEKKEVLAKRLTLMVNGLLLAHHISRVLKTCLMGHLKFEMPLSKQSIQLLALCAELLKGIQITYHHKSAMAGESVIHMCRQLSFSLQNIFLRGQNKLEQKAASTRVPTDENIDQLAALSLVLRMLNGPPTSSRRTIFTLCLCIAQPKNLLKEKDTEDLRNILWKFSLLSEWQTILSESCDTSCLFWAKDVLPTVLEHTFMNCELAQRLPYLMAAFGEGAQAARSAKHLGDTSLSDKYEEEIRNLLQEQILQPLAREVETDLRINIHAAADTAEKRNPFKHKVKAVQTFLNLKPFRLFGNMINVKQRIIDYLDTTFYNLTALTPQDWKTYAEMRNLALEKYGLELDEVYLPGATLEQGLDVLEIMRNIHIFVSKYHYNLNNQIFVEEIGENKHVNSIGISHVANSIRTHGTGIINTTVNYTYQFLVQKLFIFSQFLFDDHIKSPCMKSHKYYKENKEQLNNQYPYSRAANFNTHIRKLGVTEDGLTFLDQFRVLITEIGNALGYVRLVRSGGQHFCAGAIKFIPDLKYIANFPNLVETANLPQDTHGAAKNLHQIIGGLLDNFSEGTNFFKVLVDVFRAELNTEKNSHLQYFYIILPPLILNYLDYMSNSKDKLHKRSKEGCFTEDGFAMGLAYLLQVTNQSEKFDSLHWFNSLRDYTEELKQTAVQDEVNNRNSMKKVPQKPAQTMNLSAKRVESLEQEIELFYFSFSGARIFFNYSKVKDEEQEKTGESTTTTTATATTTTATTATAPTPVTTTSAPIPPAASIPPPPPPPPGLAAIPPPPPPPPPFMA